MDAIICTSIQSVAIKAYILMCTESLLRFFPPRRLCEHLLLLTRKDLMSYLSQRGKCGVPSLHMKKKESGKKPRKEGCVWYVLFILSMEEILDKGSPSPGKSALSSVAKNFFVCPCSACLLMRKPAWSSSKASFTDVIQASRIIYDRLFIMAFQILICQSLVIF